MSNDKLNLLDKTGLKPRKAKELMEKAKNLLKVTQLTKQNSKQVNIKKQAIAIKSSAKKVGRSRNQKGHKNF